MGYSMGGMETPLTIFLLALAMTVVVKHRDNVTYIALVAAMLVIHKIDLLPWAFGLFVATNFNPLRKEALKGVLICVLILILYLIGMYFSTGSVVPISIIRKLSDSAALNSSGGFDLPRIWFIQTALWGHRFPITLLFLLSLPALFCISDL